MDEQTLTAAVVAVLLGVVFLDSSSLLGILGIGAFVFLVPLATKGH